MPNDASPIVVACSGGSDSAATLHALALALPRARIFACYVDHRMRPQASIARDRKAVRAQARTAGAQFAELRLDDEAAHHGASREAWFRSQRYRKLAQFAREVGAAVVATGHQRDDVAESVLLALLRGSGVDGIAAMMPRRALGGGVSLVRPVLWASKPLLAEYAHAHGLAISEDESNDDLSLRRNAVRRLVAGLERISAGASRAIARSAAIAAGDKALLAGVAHAAWRAVRSKDGRSLIAASIRKLPEPLVRRVLRIEVARVAGSSKDLSFAHCAAISQAVREGRGGTFHAGRARALLSAGRLTFSARIDDERNGSAAVRIVAPRTQASVEWNGGRIQLRRVGSDRRAPSRQRTARAAAHADREGRRVVLDGAELPAGTALSIRQPRSGDRFTPAGRRTAVPLARFLAKQGLNRDERRQVPLLCANGIIVAVIGVRASAAFAPHGESSALEVAWVADEHARPRAVRR